LGYRVGFGVEAETLRVDVNEVEVGKFVNIAGVDANLYCMPNANA
jgi:hypothetical protein